MGRNFLKKVSPQTPLQKLLYGDFPMFPIICPICKTSLSLKGKSYYCKRERPHCFDMAKSGYVTLTSASHAGDDKNMVHARTAFLNTGAYQPFADSVTALLSGCHTIVDAGCGEGYYTNRIASMLPEAAVLGFDLSKSACDHAAKTAKTANTFFGTASIHTLPIADRSCDAVVSLFAPTDETEFSRILADDGILIIGAAGKHHLYELKQAVYTDVYENEGRRDLPVGFSLKEQKNLCYRFTCEGENIRHLFMMTPYAFRTSKEDTAKLDEISSLTITADFDIFVYQKVR